jgi:hypothetical protein
MFTQALSDKDSYYGIDKSIWQTHSAAQAQNLKCCCETKELVLAEGCKTREVIHCEHEKDRHLIGEIERGRQRELLCAAEARVAELSNALSNCKQTDELKEAMRHIHGRLERAEAERNASNISVNTIIGGLHDKINSLLANAN